MSLDRRLAAKGARVAGVLADFHLLDLFAERGAVSAVPVLLDGFPVGRVWLGRGREDVDRDLVPYFPVTPTSVR